MRRWCYVLLAHAALFAAQEAAGAPQCQTGRKRQPATSAPSWMVGILKPTLPGQLTVACGGVIVDVDPTSEGFEIGILTAAHCLSSTAEAVILGKVRYSVAESVPIDLSFRNSAKGLIGDLALISVLVPKTHIPPPVKIDTRTLDAAKDTSLTFYSWGPDEGAGNQLWIQTDVSLVSEPDCQKAQETYPYEDVVNAIGYCAGLSGYELVSFDSGGALVSNSGGAPVASEALVGIASASHCWVGRFSDPVWRVPEGEEQIATLPYDRLSECTRESKPNSDPFVRCSPTPGGHPIIGGKSGTFMPIDRLLSIKQRKLLGEALQSTRPVIKIKLQDKR